MGRREGPTESAIENIETLKTRREETLRFDKFTCEFLRLFTYSVWIFVLYFFLLPALHSCFSFKLLF